MSDKTKWSLEADFIQACNCDYGCPCEFSAPPTGGFCEGMGAWRITQGVYGNVKLDGLGVAFAAHWPKAIWNRNMCRSNSISMAATAMSKSET
jgi:hypothetical protein